jgi:HK97 family phage major capsid protein
MSVEEIVAALQAIIDGAADGRDLTDEEAERYAALEVQLASARRSLELRQRQAAYTTPTGRALVLAGGDGPDPRADVLARAFDAYVRTGTVSAELAEQRAQYEGSPTAGGYLVPDGFRDKLTEKIVEFGGFAAEAETLNTSSGNPLV